MLHDGPPYANGHVHYGHVLNKVLKDIVIRSQLLMGRAAPFVPGWDCHGLPIEQQVEKQVGSKDKLSVEEFRQRCEAYALNFVDVMRTEFKRLGCLGLWDTALPDAVQGVRSRPSSPSWAGSPGPGCCIGPSARSTGA